VAVTSPPYPAPGRATALGDPALLRTLAVLAPCHVIHVLSIRRSGSITSLAIINSYQRHQSTPQVSNYSDIVRPILADAVTQ
jgi:hypothetical protein